MSSKIITVTAHTAIDYVIEIGQLTLGETLLAKHNAEYPSGKGINVAKAISSLNCEVYALGIVGQNSLSLFNALKTDLLQTDYIKVEGQTRTNLTLYDVSCQQETHIRTSGFTVTTQDCQQLIAKINDLLNANDILILSGSLPKGAPVNLYATLINIGHQKSAITFLDSSGESLREGLKAKPDWIKPNHQELAELTGRTLTNEQEIVHAAYQLIQQGCQRIVVSRGRQGLLMVVDNNNVLKAYVNHIPGTIISSIGCGDALVGGLAVAALHQYPITEALKLSLNCATANLFSAEPGRFDASLFPKISEHIVIRAL